MLKILYICMLVGMHLIVYNEVGCLQKSSKESRKDSKKLQRQIKKLNNDSECNRLKSQIKVLKLDQRYKDNIVAKIQDNIKQLIQENETLKKQFLYHSLQTNSSAPITPFTPHSPFPDRQYTTGTAKTYINVCEEHRLCLEEMDIDICCFIYPECLAACLESK